MMDDAELGDKHFFLVPLKIVGFLPGDLLKIPEEGFGYFFVQISLFSDGDFLTKLSEPLGEDGILWQDDPNAKLFFR